MSKEIATIRLFKEEFTKDAWNDYCEILGIDKETTDRIISVELGISRVLPQIH